MWVIVGSSDNAGPNDAIRAEIDINNAFDGIRLCCVSYPYTYGGKDQTGYFICLDGKQESQFGMMVYKLYTPSGSSNEYPTMTGDPTYKVYNFQLNQRITNPISDNQYMPYVAYAGSSYADAQNNLLQKAREYFNSLVHGEGSFSTDIPANGKMLTFTSQVTGTIKSMLITGDAAVDVRPS